MRTTVVFDVNETLLDLAELDVHFKRIFGDATVRRRWFDLVLRNAMALTITGGYVDFVAVARASLQMVAEQSGVALVESDGAAVGEAMASLPPHSDVKPGLDLLAAAGFTLTALTNSPQRTAEAQLAAAGLAPYFSRIMSVSSVEQFKPAPAVYRAAAARLAIPINQMTMVAAHDWDVAGAMKVGAQGAYVLRPGMVRNPLFPDPSITGPDLVSVSRQLVAALG